MPPPASTLSLSDVLARGDVWRGDALASLAQATLPSGHAALDEELPGGGWPQGCLVELLTDHGGLGEMSFLLPVLSRLSAAGGWLALVTPPCLPHAPAWQAAGVGLERVVLITGGAQLAWATEQLLASGGFAGVLAWPGGGTDARVLRRWQLAVEGRPVFTVIFRSTATAAQPSPAPLRLSVSATPEGVSVQVLKRRGRAAGQAIALPLRRPGRKHRVVAGTALSVVGAGSAALTLTA